METIGEIETTDEEKHDEEGEEGEGPESEEKEGEPEGDGDAEGDAEHDDQEGRAEEGDESTVPKGPQKKLTNQFNFSERAALTYNNPVRVKHRLFSS